MVAQFMQDDGQTSVALESRIDGDLSCHEVIHRTTQTRVRCCFLNSSHSRQLELGCQLIDQAQLFGDLCTWFGLHRRCHCLSGLCRLGCCRCCALGLLCNQSLVHSVLFQCFRLIAALDRLHSCSDLRIGQLLDSGHPRGLLLCLWLGLSLGCLSHRLVSHFTHLGSGLFSSSGRSCWSCSAVLPHCVLQCHRHLRNTRQCFHTLSQCWEVSCHVFIGGLGQQSFSVDTLCKRCGLRTLQVSIQASSTLTPFVLTGNPVLVEHLFIGASTLIDSSSLIDHRFRKVTQMHHVILGSLQITRDHRFGDGASVLNQ